MRRLAFTLIELLVVVAIIAVLAAILFPVFASAKAAAKGAANLSNLKQIALAHLQYANDADDSFALMSRFESQAAQAAAFGTVAPLETAFRGEIRWTETIEPYAKSRALYVSPSESQAAGTEAARKWTEGQFYGVVGRAEAYSFEMHGVKALFQFGNPLLGTAFIDGPFGVAGSADAAFAAHRSLVVPSLAATAVERVSEVVLVADAGAHDMGFARGGHYLGEAHGPCVFAAKYAMLAAPAQWPDSFYAGPWARNGVSGAYQGGKVCRFEEGQRGSTTYAALDGSAKRADLRGKMYEKGKSKEDGTLGLDALPRLFVGEVE